jgi:hypothetical protein
METYEYVGDELHTFGPDALHGERTQGTHWMEDWVDPTTSLDVVWNTEITVREEVSWGRSVYN